MHVSVLIILPGPLGPNFDGPVTPLHYVFNDGRITISDISPNLNSSYSGPTQFYFKTDAGGAITNWLAQVGYKDLLFQYFIATERGYDLYDWADQEYEFGEVADYSSAGNDSGNASSSPGSLMGHWTSSLDASETILTYTGIPYTSVPDAAFFPGAYTTSMHVSVLIILPGPLGPNFDAPVAPLHYVFNDGRITISDITPNLNSSYSGPTQFYLKTDAGGAITNWLAQVGYKDPLFQYFIATERRYDLYDWADQEYEFGEVADYSSAGNDSGNASSPPGSPMGHWASSSNTPVGSPTVQLTDASTGTTVSMIFSNVSQAGTTAVSSSSSGPSLPANFTLTPNTYFNLNTTAIFTGSVSICFGASGQLLHYEDGAWVDVTSPGYPTATITCGTITSLSPFAVVQSRYRTTVQPPINANGASVFNASRGVVPVKFMLSLNGTSTCQLPPATIAVFKTNGTTVVSVNESDFLAPSDSGSNFRVDITNCQYIYNLDAKSLGAGTYTTKIKLSGIAVGQAVFGLK